MRKLKGITIHSDDVCRPLVTTQKRRQRDAQEEGVAVQVLAAHSIDEAQFGSFLGGFRQGLNLATENIEGTSVEVLLVSIAATGQFKGGRPTGKWFLAATLVDGNTSVRAWNTHHKGILFSRVFHPSWTDSCDGKERFQSASSGTTWSATVCEIEPTQVRDRFVLERGCISSAAGKLNSLFYV